METDAWSLGYTSVNGREEICVAGERLSVISAPVYLIYMNLLFEVGVLFYVIFLWLEG